MTVWWKYLPKCVICGERFKPKSPSQKYCPTHSRIGREARGPRFSPPCLECLHVVHSSSPQFFCPMQPRWSRWAVPARRRAHWG
jgi:hypothetical protein